MKSKKSFCYKLAEVGDGKKQLLLLLAHDCEEKAIFNCPRDGKFFSENNALERIKGLLEEFHSEKMNVTHEESFDNLFNCPNLDKEVVKDFFAKNTSVELD